MQPCLKIVKGWWTYEFCYMKLLHQYRSEGSYTSVFREILANPFALLLMGMILTKHCDIKLAKGV